MQKKSVTGNLKPSSWRYDLLEQFSSSMLFDSVILLPGGLFSTPVVYHTFWEGHRWGACSITLLGVDGPATAGRIFKQVTKPVVLQEGRTENGPTQSGFSSIEEQKHRRLRCDERCDERCAAACAAVASLPRGGRDCIFRREWAYSPSRQRQALCLRMLGLLWPGYF